MKRFSELTEEQQARAIEKAMIMLLEALLEGSIRFSDDLNHDNLQARIDEAVIKAENMRTPWFAHEYIMDTCCEEIMGMARCDAEEAFYTEPGELVIAGVL